MPCVYAIAEWRRMRRRQEQGKWRQIRETMITIIIIVVLSLYRTYVMRAKVFYIHDSYIRVYIYVWTEGGANAINFIVLPLPLYTNACPLATAVVRMHVLQYINVGTWCAHVINAHCMLAAHRCRACIICIRRGRRLNDGFASAVQLQSFRRLDYTASVRRGCPFLRVFTYIIIIILCSFRRQQQEY